MITLKRVLLYFLSHQDAGYYEGEIEVTYLSGVIETLYEILEFYLRDDF